MVIGRDEDFRNWMRPGELGTAVILGSGASCSYGLPMDRNFFRSQTVKGIMDTHDLNELARFVTYLGCERLEETFTLLETFSRWCNFAKDSSPNLINSISRFHGALPYAPISPALDNVLKGVAEGLFQDDVDAYLDYDIEALGDHQNKLAEIFEEVEEGKTLRESW